MKTISRVVIIVLSIILVLAMASCGPKEVACAYCAGTGSSECKTMRTQQMQAYLSGEPQQYRHDCYSCTNGIQACDKCNGTGKQPAD